MDESSRPSRKRPGASGIFGGRYAPYALAVSYLLAVVGLIALRAGIDSLDFLSVGWIFALAVVPLLPLLVPRLGAFLKAVSPYLEGVKVGVVELNLRSVIATPIDLDAIAPQLVAVSSQADPQFGGTEIQVLVNGLQRSRSPTVQLVLVVDLQAGRKWRLPNLYFLTRLLQSDAAVEQLIFTEARGGSDGYPLGTTSISTLRRAIERVPGYAQASASVNLPSDLTGMPEITQAVTAFNAFRSQLPTSPEAAADSDPRGWVTSSRLSQILAGGLSTAAIEEKETLTAEDLHIVLLQSARFVPMTAGGRLSGVIDSTPIARAVARATVTRM